MEEKRIEFGIGGVTCDNEQCDFKDDNVTIDQFPEWLNKPCPKCGNNLLTPEDFKNVAHLIAVSEMLNNMSDEQYRAIVPNADDKKEWVKVRYNTHKEISIESIEKIGQ